MQSINIINVIEKRLNVWADWIMRQNDWGLGYPKQSIEAHLMKYGNIVIQQSNQPVLMSNPDAEEIENEISVLAKQTQILADALRVYYLTIGTMEQKAKKLNVSHAQLRIYLNMAKQWLAGRLS